MEYADPSCLLFGKADVVTLYSAVWDAVGKPEISAMTAWAVWQAIVDCLVQLQNRLES